ncbi:neuroendocrine convertase 1-like [Echeneis naucrates]|uniref:neuroendocrine convertase 1-like n=1 Tax=Echeneis naucrates TaxID=173247 RepID=UPI00111442D6|nr:neuroendocrine convertase 1-like [Echeneis naucrates]
MVQQAAHFNTVAPQRKCTKELSFNPTRILSSGGGVSVTIQSDACHGMNNEISTLEHVQVRVSVSAVCRGDLSISLESPGGTVSLLLDTRPNDASTAGLQNWTLMTVHCWGEQPEGLWTFQVTDHSGTVRSCTRGTEEEAAGSLLSVSLILYGTYHPHRTVDRRPLQSIVSMGSRHPVPPSGEYKRGWYPPLDLIQWVYQMERNGKVRAADITVPVRPKLQKSIARPVAVELFETSEAITDEVIREIRSLPSQTLQDAVIAEVP